MAERRIFALRGATRSLNTRDDIEKQTVEMYDELLSRNKLEPEDLVSIIFSVTSDLDAMNPATALRGKGRAAETALFVTQEAYFPGSLERVIRVLIHCYLDTKPVYVYRNGAETLRQLTINNENEIN